VKEEIKFSLKKTLAKVLIGVAFVLYILPIKQANAWELTLPSGWTTKKTTFLQV
jgi:hypothetical protein